MTRKVKCGNTQKHTKMPADATPWEELSRDVKTNVHSKRGRVNKIKTEIIKEKELIEKIVKSEDEPSAEIEKAENEPSIKIEKDENEPSIKIEKDEYEPSIKIRKDENEPSTETSNEGPVSGETKTKHLNHFKGEDKVSTKKKIFWEKLQQRRLENGVTLLSPKQERKIYLIKKRLRQKGLPSEVIRDIIRKKRRAEEIQFRKTFTTKICFNCRERGHLLSDCPQRLGSTNQVTGICFKCGSTEHVSYRCSKQVDGYPLAKCFICKQQGHISKECPKNKKGVYIKGGSCNVCGNINHLQKDCPTLRKKKEEHVVPAYTIYEGTSIDAEIMEESTVPRKKIKKGPKVVKF